MDNIRDKKHGELVVLDETACMLFVRRVADESHRSFWIPKKKLEIVVPKRKKANV